MSSQRYDDKDQVMAIFSAYLDCPNCGRIPMPTGTFRVPRDSTSYSFPACFTCEKCGYEKAILHVEKKIAPFH